MKNLILTLALFLVFNHFVNAQQLPPNFIIFIADDISWDDFGCYGNSDVKTPNIDALAKQGMLFTNTYLTASSCSPSRNSIMTGRYPHNTGAAELHTSPPDQMKAFPEMLRQAGYYSAMSGKFHMGEYAKRGFDEIITDLSLIGNGGENQWVNQLQDRPRNKPFFMWFAAYDAHRDWGENQFSGTHNPYSITVQPYFADTPATRRDLTSYYDEIARFDHYIGQVMVELEKQEIADNTMIIVMADNGRAFPHSKTRVNDQGMKTPFIVHWPQTIEPGQECSSLVSVIDIAPTLLSLAGAEMHEQMQGASFEELLHNPGKKFRNFVFAEHNWHDYEAHQRMVRNENFMFILNSRPQFNQPGPADAVSSDTYKDLAALMVKGELTPLQADIFMTPRPAEEFYELEFDPAQMNNLATNPRYQENLEELRKVLQLWMEETGDYVPENITHDWYLREPGYIHTINHNIRGEMPGSETNAIESNQKGPF